MISAAVRGTSPALCCKNIWLRGKLQPCRTRIMRSPTRLARLPPSTNFRSSFWISMLISALCMSVADSLNSSFWAKFCACVVIAVNSLTYYICKWLDGDDKRQSAQGLSPSQNGIEKPRRQQLRGFSYCFMSISIIFPMFSIPYYNIFLRKILSNSFHYFILLTLY